MTVASHKYSLHFVWYMCVWQPFRVNTVLQFETSTCGAKFWQWTGRYCRGDFYIRAHSLQSSGRHWQGNPWTFLNSWEHHLLCVKWQFAQLPLLVSPCHQYLTHSQAPPHKVSTDFDCTFSLHALLCGKDWYVCILLCYNCHINSDADPSHRHQLWSCSHYKNDNNIMTLTSSGPCLGCFFLPFICNMVYKGTHNEIHG